MPLEGALAQTSVDWGTLGQALALLALAIVLLVLEFFIVSFGLLLACSIACAGGAVYLAFVASDVAGWSLVVATPAIGAALTRWGLKRIRASRVVPKAEIIAEAGYHHAAERVGASPGAIGEMITAAMPSGRARFDGGECDVQSRSGALERGAQVRVERIDGPMVYVVPVADDAVRHTGA